MNRLMLLLGGLAIAGLWFFPLFHIVRLDNIPAIEQETAFDAPEFARRFWGEQLIPAIKNAPEAQVVLDALREQSQIARSEFGRKVGISRTRYFLLKGAGSVVAIDEQGVSLIVEQKGNEADVVLYTGMLFGNAVRDTTGLLNAGNFRHSQDFNDISTELNRMVEEQVITKLKEQANVGQMIRFIGCAELLDDRSVPRPLTVIPLEVHFE